MGYCGLMGYGVQIPANQVGGPKMVWYFRVYGLSQPIQSHFTLFKVKPPCLYHSMSDKANVGRSQEYEH
jgi:hypothetical protein